jgi:hypothetical protein
MLNLALVPYQMRLSLVIIGSSNYNLTSHFRVIADVVSAFPQSLHYSSIIISERTTKKQLKETSNTARGCPLNTRNTFISDIEHGFT